MTDVEEAEAPAKVESFRFVCAGCGRAVVGKDFLRTNRALGADGWEIVPVGARGEWKLHCSECLAK